MQLSEIYESKQGEGILVGTPSLFIRTSGCNLRCQFCDTPFTSWNPEGTQILVDELLAQVEQASCDHVVITGGKPLISKEMVELTNGISRLGKHITIETAGTVFQNVKCDLMSISPKMSNSTPSFERAGAWQAKHEKSRINIDAVQKLIALSDYQLKFVVQNVEDLAEIDAFLSKLQGVVADRVLLMPEGVTQDVLEERQAWLQPLCESRGNRFCQRQHIFWYGNRRGT